MQMHISTWLCNNFVTSKAHIAYPRLNVQVFISSLVDTNMIITSCHTQLSDPAFVTNIDLARSAYKWGLHLSEEVWYVVVNITRTASSHAHAQ